jgi:hypothetical protein
VNLLQRYGAGPALARVVLLFPDALAAGRAAGVKGEIDHFGALNFLRGLLTVFGDSGGAGLLIVLDEVETLQRVRGDVRDKGLNALRQLLDEVDGGRFPGLYVLVTGTPAFFDGPQGIHRLEPLVQRLHVDFGTEARFDNPRAVQIRLAAFDLDRLAEVGCRVRSIYQEHCPAADRIAEKCDDAYVRDSAGRTRPARASSERSSASGLHCGRRTQRCRASTAGIRIPPALPGRRDCASRAGPKRRATAAG